MIFSTKYSRSQWAILRNHIKSLQETFESYQKLGDHIGVKANTIVSFVLGRSKSLSDETLQALSEKGLLPEIPQEPEEIKEPVSDWKGETKTVAEAAYEKGYAASTIRKYLKIGKLHFVIIGKRKHVVVDELYHALKQMELGRVRAERDVLESENEKLRKQLERGSFVKPETRPEPAVATVTLPAASLAPKPEVKQVPCAPLTPKPKVDEVPCATLAPKPEINQASDFQYPDSEEDPIQYPDPKAEDPIKALDDYILKVQEEMRARMQTEEEWFICGCYTYCINSNTCRHGRAHRFRDEYADDSVVSCMNYVIRGQEPPKEPIASDVYIADISPRSRKDMLDANGNIKMCEKCGEFVLRTEEDHQTGKCYFCR